MTQTHIFLSCHFPDRFPASEFVLLPQGQCLAYDRAHSHAGPLALLSGGWPHLRPHPRSPSRSGSAVPACSTGVRLVPRPGAACLLRGVAQRGGGAGGVAGASLPAERPGLAPGPGCSRRAHCPRWCLVWRRCVSLSIWTEQAVRPLFQALFFFFLEQFLRKERRKK